MPRNKETLVPLNIIDNLASGFYFTILRVILLESQSFLLTLKGIFKSPNDKFTF